MYFKYINLFAYFNILNFLALKVFDKENLEVAKTLFNKYSEHIIIDNMFFFLTLLSGIYFGTLMTFKIMRNTKNTIQEGIKIKNKFNGRKK